VSTNKCAAVGDMPPELIVTSAQAQLTDVDTNEKVQETQVEGTVTRESENQQTEKIRRRKSRQKSVRYVCVPICKPYTVPPVMIKLLQTVTAVV
jgi:Flp pilus assembly protein TadG